MYFFTVSHHFIRLYKLLYQTTSACNKPCNCDVYDEKFWHLSPYVLIYHLFN